MKQFINAHILCFVLILLQFSLFSSCKDDDTVGELKLDRAAIQIKEGSEGILKVENGSGGYQFSFSDEGYASAKYRENLIYTGREIRKGDNESNRYGGTYCYLRYRNCIKGIEY